ncbi:MAG: hypothetical protein JWN52_5727 [Actinomycetia bacterium]|nr:hypothetical protein [Actinomycetes bacterium]
MAVSVEARDGNLNMIGPIVWDKVDLISRYNQVGAWTLTLPATPQNWALANVSNLGILVDWNGVYTFSGYLETWAPSRAIADNGAVIDTITLSGADDLGLIANRIAYPVPASPWAAQTAGASDAQTGVCETVIKHFVNVNAGPGALVARRAPHLTIATDLARGTTVSFTARIQDGTDIALMSIIRLLVATGGPMGVKVTQTGANLVFDVYVPRDLHDLAWFSPQLGNLRTFSLTDSTPTATSALVRGSTAFTEISSADASNAWRHAEVLVDQAGSTDATQMTQAGTDAITQGAGAAQLQLQIVDLPLLRFGADYGLGDRVTVEIRNGVSYADIVTAVQLVADSSGSNYVETVTPTIGAAGSDSSGDATATARLAAEVRALRKALQRLQAV